MNVVWFTNIPFLGLFFFYAMHPYFLFFFFFASLYLFQNFISVISRIPEQVHVLKEEFISCP